MNTIVYRKYGPTSVLKLENPPVFFLIYSSILAFLKRFDQKDICGPRIFRTVL